MELKVGETYAKRRQQSIDIVLAKRASDAPEKAFLDLYRQVEAGATKGTTLNFLSAYALLDKKREAAKDKGDDQQVALIDDLFASFRLHQELAAAHNKQEAYLEVDDYKTLRNNGKKAVERHKELQEEKKEAEKLEASKKKQDDKERAKQKRDAAAAAAVEANRSPLDAAIHESLRSEDKSIGFSLGGVYAPSSGKSDDEKADIIRKHIRTTLKEHGLNEHSPLDQQRAAIDEEGRVLNYSPEKLNRLLERAADIRTERADKAKADQVQAKAMKQTTWHGDDAPVLVAFHELLGDRNAEGLVVSENARFSSRTTGRMISDWNQEGMKPLRDALLAGIKKVGPAFSQAEPGSSERNAIYAELYQEYAQERKAAPNNPYAGQHAKEVITILKRAEMLEAVHLEGVTKIPSFTDYGTFNQFSNNAVAHAAKCAGVTLPKAAVAEPAPKKEKAEAAAPAQDSTPAPKAKQLQQRDTFHQLDAEEKAAVSKLQSALMKAGYDLPKFGADGKFGPETAQAWAAYQKDHGMKVNGAVAEESQVAALINPKAAPAKNVKLTQAAEAQVAEAATALKQFPFNQAAFASPFEFTTPQLPGFPQPKSPTRS